ncbi:MAG: hypothetical protein H0U74_13885 [Bradymonadaceae bacterium]|nr:hypothetical protein [Lujinxingiaceae bacterium]
MMNRTALISILAFLVFFAAGFLVACTVAFDDQVDNLYYCEKDADCIQPAYECSQNNVCKRIEAIPVVDCADADGDGFGRPETDRSTCPGGPEPDCDDDDPAVYPGAPEICDGRLNNCLASEIDVAPCNVVGDCPAGQTDPNGVSIKYVCESSACVAKARKEICIAPADPCPECQSPLLCRGGTLDTVPPACL